MSSPGRGSTLQVWVQPRASRDEVVGNQGDELKIRLRAPPVEGEANYALLRFLAKSLRVPQKTLKILRGTSGRRKTVWVEGLTSEEVNERLGLTSP